MNADKEMTKITAIVSTRISSKLSRSLKQHWDLVQWSGAKTWPVYWHQGKLHCGEYFETASLLFIRVSDECNSRFPNRDQELKNIT